jgi:hypothetical protein
MNTQKKYIASYSRPANGSEYFEEELFHASNLKEVKQAAQHYKRMNNIKGITRVRVCWSNHKEQ